MTEKNNAETEQPKKKGSRLGILFGFQHVVPANEAVILTDKNGKREYSAREYTTNQVMQKVKDDKSGREFEVPLMVKDPETGDERPVYERVPRTPNTVYPKYGKFQKAIRVPLSNLRVAVDGVKLNDSNMAEFMCDVVCFVNVSNATVAAERTTITQSREAYEGRDAPGTNVHGLRIEVDADFKAIIESVCRTAATQQTILELYKNRAKFQQAVQRQVKDLFPQWGLELVNLEIPTIRDAESSTIIHDIERKNAAVIHADAEVTVAENDMRARIARAERDRDAKLKEAEAAEIAGKRTIEKDQVLGVTEQSKQQAIQLQSLETNAKTVEAKRKLDTGLAEIAKQVAITNAEAMQRATILAAEASKQKAELEGFGEGARLRQIGEGEGAAVKAKAVGQAEGTERLAEAQKRYAEAGALEAKKIDAIRDVLLAQAEAGGKIAQNARINIISGNSQDLIKGGLFGTLGIGAKEGAALEQFGKALGLNDEQMAKIAAGLANPNPLQRNETISGVLRTESTSTEQAAVKSKN